MRILGIESSCDDTGVAIVENGHQVLYNGVSSQIEIHRPYGGVVPEIASRAHTENLLPLLTQCMDSTHVSPADCDAIAVTYTPGLAGCLLVGMSFAKALAYALKKPLIGINHLEAHIYSPVLDASSRQIPPFPHLSLLVSGGHTALYVVQHWTHLEIVGSTKDDAAGEAFDKVAKALNLGYPGGPLIQKRAQNYEGKLIDFPRPMIHDGYDFSFSGLKTAVINHLHNHDKSEEGKTKICASFQDAVVDVLVTKTIRVAKDRRLNHISLVGGVSANQVLRDELSHRAKEEGIQVYLPEKRFAMDNGAMIAGLAHHYFQEGKFSGLSLNAIP